MSRKGIQATGLALLLLWSSEIAGQQALPFASVMFYNLENLYDTKDDSLKRDEEFMPDGDRHWSGYRLDRKSTRLNSSH